MGEGSHDVTEDHGANNGVGSGVIDHIKHRVHPVRDPDGDGYREG